MTLFRAIIITGFFCSSFARDPFFLPNTPGVASHRYVLRAVVNGECPTASIECNGKQCAACVGEDVGDAKILSIDEDCVTLRERDGRTVKILLKH